jgi:serine/threonine-protein kinase
MSAETGTSPSAPIRAAIDDQGVRNERFVCWGGVVEGVTGAAISSMLWAAASAHWITYSLTGPVNTAVFSALTAWYVLALWMLRQGRGKDVLPWLNPVVEAVFPSALMAIEARLVGGRFAAFGSVGPPLYAVALSLAVLRLRWQVPLVVGLVAAAGYAAVIGTWMIPAVTVGDGDLTYGTPLFLYLRPLVVLLIGLTSSAITLRLRRSVAEVHQQVRSQELFGKYQVGGRIAAGGMGEVFRATYALEGGLERVVAIKRIHPHLAADASVVEAFRQECQLTSRLTHPNIVQVIDFGSEGDGYFLAMELVEGTSLLGLLRATRQRSEPLPAGLVAWIGKQIALGLAFAHQEARDASGQPMHVIHRDLTPGNILLSQAGEVKISDFGVAKALGAREATLTSTVAGKISYMAPEQALAQSLDARGDLYALGVVLWEALCGQRLFRGTTDAETLGKVLGLTVPPPSTVRSDLSSPRWDEVILRAVERDKERRFPDAQGMVVALDEILAAEAPTGPEELGAWVKRARDSAATQGDPSPAMPELSGTEVVTATVKARP